MKDKEVTPEGKQTIAGDWSDIHRRFETIHAQAEQGAPSDTENKKNILKARAKFLAKQVEKKEKEEDYIEILEFLLANEHYGIESKFIREVYPLKEYTPLPCTPRFVLGLINVRGQIFSIIDIKTFFNLPDKGLSDSSKVIILHNEKMEFGILADAGLGVRHVGLSELQPSLPTLTGIREEYLKGVTKEGLVVLDAHRLLSDKNIIVNEEIKL